MWPLASIEYLLGQRQSCLTSLGPYGRKLSIAVFWIFGLILGAFWHALRLFPYVPLSPIAEMSQKGSKRAPKPPQRVPGGTNKGQMGCKCIPKDTEWHLNGTQMGPKTGLLGSLEKDLNSGSPRSPVFRAPGGGQRVPIGPLWPPLAPFGTLLGAEWEPIDPLLAYFASLLAHLVPISVAEALALQWILEHAARVPSGGPTHCKV